MCVRVCGGEYSRERLSITLTCLDGPARLACTDAPTGGDLVPTLASAEHWGAVVPPVPVVGALEPPAPVANARGLDCLSMDFRTAEIHGLRFGAFEAAMIPASSDGAAAAMLTWGCFSARGDFRSDFPPMSRRLCFRWQFRDLSDERTGGLGKG